MTTGVKCDETDVCVIKFVTIVDVVGYESVQIVDVKQSSVVPCGRAATRPAEASRARFLSEYCILGSDA